MAEVNPRRNGELLRGVFRILRDHPEGLPAHEVLSKLESDVPPNDFDKSEYPNRPGIKRYGRIVRFSTITCVKSGWLVKSQGRWSLTESGRKAFDKFADPESFAREATRGFRKWKKERGASGDEPEGEGSVEVPPSALGTLEEAEERATDEIRAYLEEIDPYDFQRLVVGLLKGMGYRVHWDAPPGADGGIDAIAFPDALGVSGPTIRVGVRRRAQKQDVGVVREFLSQIHEQEVGIYVSTGGFTSDAEKAARHDWRRLRLLDFDKLLELWIEYYSRIPEAERALLPVRPVYFLAPRGSE